MGVGWNCMEDGHEELTEGRTHKKNYTFFFSFLIGLVTSESKLGTDIVYIC